MAIVRLVERLTSEQIRLLEELRELRDAGILTIDEFDSEVVKVLGRSQFVDGANFENQTIALGESGDVAGDADETPQPDATVASEIVSAQEKSVDNELLEYQLDDAETAEELNNPLAESQVDEPTTSKDVSDTVASGLDAPRGGPRRKILLVGGVVGLVVIATLTVLALGGDNEEVEVATRSGVEASAPSTQTAVTETDMAPTSEAATSTTAESTTAPTTTYEVLQCPYTRVIDAVDGKIVTPEGVVIETLPVAYKWEATNVYAVGNPEPLSTLVVDEYVPFKNGHDMEVTNPSGLRLRIGMEIRWSWASGLHSESKSWSPDNGNGWVNGVTGFVRAPRGLLTDNPAADVALEIVRSEVKFLCP